MSKETDSIKCQLQKGIDGWSGACLTFAESYLERYVCRGSTQLDAPIFDATYYKSPANTALKTITNWAKRFSELRQNYTKLQPKADRVDLYLAKLQPIVDALVVGAERLEASKAADNVAKNQPKPVKVRTTPLGPNAATHSGTCQICGSVQLLPNGRLAKHGYTTRWGFFSGTCRGSHHLPFEQDKGLIDASIKNAEERITLIEELQVDLRRPATTGACWVNERGPRGTRIWTQVYILTDGEPQPSFRYVYGDSTISVPYHRVFGIKTIEKLATKFNAEYADSLNKDVAQLNSYIKWQTERVANWKSQPLLPRRD